MRLDVDGGVTVRELTDALQHCDPNAPVMVQFMDFWENNVYAIDTVYDEDDGDYEGVVLLQTFGEE